MAESALAGCRPAWSRRSVLELTEDINAETCCHGGRVQSMMSGACGLSDAKKASRGCQPRTTQATNAPGALNDAVRGTAKRRPQPPESHHFRIICNKAIRPNLASRAAPDLQNDGGLQQLADLGNAPTLFKKFIFLGSKLPLSNCPPIRRIVRGALPLIPRKNNRLPWCVVSLPASMSLQACSLSQYAKTERECSGPRQQFCGVFPQHNLVVASFLVHSRKVGKHGHPKPSVQQRCLVPRPTTMFVFMVRSTSGIRRLVRKRNRTCFSNMENKGGDSVVLVQDPYLRRTCNTCTPPRCADHDELKKFSFLERTHTNCRSTSANVRSMDHFCQLTLRRQTEIACRIGWSRLLATSKESHRQ